MGKSLLKQALERVGPNGVFEALSPEQRERFAYEWKAWARPEQLIPEGYRVTLLLAGRRFGKTRSAAEWVRARVESGEARNIILVAPTHNDMLTDMLNGPSGLLTISPPWDKPVFRTTDNTITWANGARAICLSAEKPERTRGKETDTIWCDEIAAWSYPHMWDLLQFCGGAKPMRFVVTTTPRPTELVRSLVKTSDLVIRGSTYDNTDNLDAKFIEQMRSKHEGTRLGRQELYAELLEDVEGALWNHDIIDKARRHESPPALTRVVVAVDPSGSAKKTADEAGIVVAGVADCACLGRVEQHAFVLEDKTSRYSPRNMGEEAIAAYYKWHCDRLLAEDNYGGQIIHDLISLIDTTVAYRAVHATRGKIIRAEPIAALYEQGKVHHVGMFKELEDEMCSYAPLVSTESPGRLDALVWALTDLMLGLSAPNNESTYDAPMVLAEGDTAAERALNSRVDEICS